MILERGSAGPVRIAWTRVDAVSADALDAVTRFGASQRRRHDELEPARAARFAAGRWLLARLLTDLAVPDGLTLTSVCDRCGGDHGRPRVVGAPLAVSISHSGDTVAAAVVGLDHALELGIDLERGTEESGPREDLAPLFAPQPPPDLRGWTLIEAAVKADGRGVRVSPADVRVGGMTAGLLPGGRAVRLPGRADPLEAAPATGPNGYLLSVAVIPAMVPAATRA